MSENVQSFIAELTRSLAEKTFVKMTLGNYKGSDEHLQKINVRLIETKKGVRLFFLYKHDTRDTAKNYSFDEGRNLIERSLDGQFFSGHLFTTTNDLQLDIGKGGRSRLNVAKPTFKAPPVLEHDRQKRIQIDPHAFYLSALGITTETGEVRDKQQDKWRQINKFVETLASLVEKSALKGRTTLKIVDMGSGKGYLTFAAYDFFRNHIGIDVHLTGVDTKSELVGLCNDIARASEFDGLQFVHGTIGSFDVGNADILIALHACNTATDDAIYKGIIAGAELIVAAPCCHQQVRPQISPPEMFRDILKHGTLLERTAEMLTDGLRSLLMERCGYATKIFEFVSVEHTPKNVMLVGTRLAEAPDTAEIARQIDKIKHEFGISELRLEELLKPI